MADLPTGTVTFLFTDLEDSTRLWEEYPDAMKAALARHDEILRGAIAAHGGDATTVITNFNNLSKTDQQDIIFFLRSL